MSLGHMDANHNIEDKKWAKLAQSIYEPATAADEEVSETDEWVFDAKEKKQLVPLAKRVDLYFELKKYPADEAWQKVEQQIQLNTTRPATRLRKMIGQPFMRFAAAILVAAMLSFGGYEIYFNWTDSRPMVELSVPTKATRTITLPDGTLVSLNSNTQLKYPKKFAQSTREVSIEGEAFFEVKPDKNKPFIIHAGNAQIKVLGTSFNVNAYSAAKLLEVIVKTGKVQVINQGIVTAESNELILNPGDKGTLVYSSNALLKTTNENPNFLAWKTHELIFKATALGEVISNLENVYKVSIRLEDPTLNGLLLTAHFNNYSLDFILKVIETTFQMETEKIDGHYILKSKS